MAENAASVIEAVTGAAPVQEGGAPKPTEQQLTDLFGPDPDASPAQPSDADPGDEAKSESKEEHPKKEDDAQDGERDAIVQRLITSGVPAGVIKNASWADLQKWDKVAAKREADIQSAFQERADLKKRVEELAKTATSKTPEPSSGVPTGAEDLKADFAELIEVWGADLEKPLAGFAEKLLARAESRIEAKYAERFGQANLGTLAAKELLIEGARAQLMESFPELSDDTKFGKVVEKMETLAMTGAYSDAPTVRAGAKACMEDACGLVFKAKSSADQSKKKEVSRARDNGQPIVRSTNTPPRALTSEQVAWQRFNAREEGASDDEVQRIR